jgi:hypothetical protein
METFKYGETVSHKLYGTGRVHNVYPDAPLVQVFFDGDTTPGGTVVHPVSLTKVTVPKFEARIEWKHGAVTLSGALDKRELRQYMSRLDENDMNGYTVIRLNNERD